MNKFITTYKWIYLPVILSSAAVLTSSATAVPTSQHYKDAQQTSRVSQQFVGGNAQIGAGITDQGHVDLQINKVLSRSKDRSTSGGLWAEYDVVGESTGFQGRGVEVNHNWVSRDKAGQAKRINKAKAAYDRNASGHEKVTLGYGQEHENKFWEGRVSKGLSGRKNTRTSGADTISDRGYEYGIGASIGKFLPNSNVRVRGGLDHEWSTEVGNNESDAKNTTLSAGVEKFFNGTGHSVSLDVSGSRRSGGFEDGGSSDNDYSARLGYKYDFAGSNAFQNATTTRRVRVEVPSVAAAPRIQAKKAPEFTYKTVPVYGKKTVKVAYKRIVKSTMGLEGQTFFKLNSSKLIPSAQIRLTQIANQIRKTGYKGSIRITGNTCGLGNAKYDQILSEKRAKSVRDFLISKGFNPEHLMARGLGKDHPKYRNIPGEGFKNRRVDIEYVSEVNTTQTAYRNEEKTVQTGTRKVATGFKGQDPGSKNVMIDSGKPGSPRVIWKTETVNNPPAWIQRALNNNIRHDRTINTFQTTEGFETPPVVAPVATNDRAQTACGVPVTIDVLGNDSDNAATISEFTNGTNGTVTRGPNNTLIYTPTGDTACGLDDTFTYTISDGNGGFDTAQVTVTVDEDVTVVATNEKTNAVAGEDVIIDVLANDDSDATITRIVTQPANGTASVVNGKIVYRSNTNFAGSDSFTYEVTDANGNTAIATVEVHVDGAVNTPPIAINDTSTVACSAPVTINVLNNDNDTDTANNLLSVLDFTQPSNGTVALDANGQLVYTSNGNSCGTKDQFTYRITDGVNPSNSATVSVNIDPKENTAPVAVDDTVKTEINTPIMLMTIANDTDADGDTLTITNVGQPQNGTVTTDGSKITYTPNPGFSGVDVFDYTISDDNGGTAMATETVNVSDAPNTSPTANDDSAMTEFNQMVTLDTIANDTDPENDNLTITNVGQPANGTATIVSNGTQIKYTPNPGFSGVDIFDYTISDGNGGTAMATETVTVKPAPNTKPTANDDSAMTEFDQMVTLDTIANDTDPENDSLTITNVGQPANGTATIVSNGTQIKYTPNPGFSGIDVFDYTISDGNGGTSMATETVTVKPAPNTKPIAVDDATHTFEQTPVDIMTVMNDSDADGDTLTITNVANPANGSATISANGQKITYTPDPGFTGVETFDYTISDGNGGTATATETVTVNPLSDKISTGNDSVTIDQDTSVDINVLLNDTGVGTTTITSVSTPSFGTATAGANGVITYTPNPGFVGEDVFFYDIVDATGEADFAQVTVTIVTPATK